MPYIDNDIKTVPSSELNSAFSVAKNLLHEIEKVVIGKRREIILLITALFSGGHVLIEDVPGVGKTSLASALAKSAGLDFRRAQFTPDVMASDITGFNIYNRQNERFEFREGLVMCNLLLADEINRASPKTQSSLLEAMEENSVSVDGVRYELPDPFMVIATQNPTGYIGTYPLPEAQLDRFSLKLSMGYPTAKEEFQIVSARRLNNPIDNISAVANAKIVSSIRDFVADINIEEEIYHYIVKLVSATRHNESISLGASPRASVALMKLSQAYAFLHRRDYVLPEDVAAIYPSAIAHRLLLSQDAKLNRISTYDILAEILKNTPAPFKGKR